METQRKIAHLLTKAKQLKQKREQANQIANKLLQSIFTQMFGDPATIPKEWKDTTFESIAIIERKSVLPNNIEEGTKYIGLENIEKDTGKILNWVSVRKNELRSNKFVFTENHVLYGKLRPYLNKVSLPTFSGVCSTDILPILPKKDKANRYFVAYLLKQYSFIKYASERAEGANLPRLKPNDLEKFAFSLPPYEVQERFASIAYRVTLLKNKQDNSLIEIYSLFNSLISKAFKGELVQ